MRGKAVTLKMNINSNNNTNEKKSTGCKRNAATAAAILASTRALLQEEGYANFTIEEVARRSGSSKSTIYRWWPSKMHLLLEIHDDDIKKIIDIPDFENVEAEIIFLIHTVWKRWRETPSGQAYKSMIAEVQADPSAFTLWRSRFLPNRRKQLLLVLQRAAERGELRPDVELEIVVDIIFGFSWYHLLTGQIDDDIKVITAMVNNIMQGITRKNISHEPVQ